MKVAPWAAVKLAIIAVFTVSVILYPVDSLDTAQVLGTLLAICAVILAMFQLALWLSYDVITLKRGGWILPSFGTSPWAKQTGPGFHFAVIDIALLTMGAAKMLAALHQGIPSLVLGGWFVGVGLFLRVWQTALYKLFRRRFAVSATGSDSAAPPSNFGQQGS